jgi:hypothetical protein
MTEANSIASGRIDLSSTEANIPLLAIEAANELDEFTEGRATSFDYVKRLAEILKKSFRLDQKSEHRQSFVDSGTVAVFSQAIDYLAPGEQISTLEELAQRAMEIVSGLEQSASSQEKFDLKKMRDFCIALSNAAAAYQQSIYEMRPSHPFRT